MILPVEVLLLVNWPFIWLLSFDPQSYLYLSDCMKMCKMINLKLFTFIHLNSGIHENGNDWNWEKGHVNYLRRGRNTFLPISGEQTSHQRSPARSGSHLVGLNWPWVWHFVYVMTMMVRKLRYIDLFKGI